jgi:hypothetical protein
MRNFHVHFNMRKTPLEIVVVCINPILMQLIAAQIHKGHANRERLSTTHVKHAPRVYIIHAICMQRQWTRAVLCESEVVLLTAK